MARPTDAKPKTTRQEPREEPPGEEEWRGQPVRATRGTADRKDAVGEEDRHRSAEDFREGDLGNRNAGDDDEQGDARRRQGGEGHGED